MESACRISTLGDPTMSSASSAEQPKGRSMPLGDKDRDGAGTAIPAGDSPPRAMWPLWLVAAAWLAWLAFLAVMMVQRISTAPV